MIISGFHTTKGPKQIVVDYISSALLIKPAEHYQIHEGKRWIVSNYFTNVDVASSAIIRFKSPEEVYMHMVFNFFASGGSLVSIYEDSTYTHVSANELIPINRNRASSNESLIQEVCFSPAGTENSSGLILPPQRIGATGGAQARLPGESRDANEFILKLDTVYSIVVLSETDNTVVNIGMDWYETGITF